MLGKGLGFLQIFIGVGALGGGSVLILDPSGGILGIPLEILDETPFSSYLIPGLVLFLVNGAGSILAARFSLQVNPYASVTGMALGIFLMVWILFQVYWFKGFHGLHTFYLILGLIEFVLSWHLKTKLGHM